LFNEIDDKIKNDVKKMESDDLYSKKKILEDEIFALENEKEKLTVMLTKVRSPSNNQ
jgi:hypothetical protein